MPPDVKYYAIGVGGATQVGTVAVASPLAGVTGTGTSFLTGHQVGDTIVVGGEEHTIAIIISDTLLTTVLPWAQTVSGQPYILHSLGQTLEGRGVPFPKSVYDPYSQLLDLGDGSVRGGGWPVAEWHWGYLTRPQRQILRAELPVTAPAAGNPGGLVRLRTMTNEQNDTFVTFKGQMLWPHPEPKDHQRRIPFVLKFRALVDLS